MGKNNKKNDNLNIQESLSENQLYDVFKVAENIYNTRFKDYSTPQLANQQLSSITMNSKNIDEQGLDNAIRNPNIRSSQETLIGYSEWLTFSEIVGKRSLDYIGNLPSFDYTFYCKNIEGLEDYDSEEYKRDLSIVKQFLSKFNVRQQFSSIHRRTTSIDAYYGILRTEGENWVFEELPYQYCMITGKSSEYGFVFDFNMEWFLEQGLSIENYPKNFKSIWKRVFGESKTPVYDVANPLDKRKGVFGTWTQTSPLLKEGAFTCFKFNSDSYASIPFLTSLFKDEVNKPLVRKLQNNQYIIASQKLLVGLIPFLKDTKTAQTKDNLAIDAKTLGGFLALLKKGLSDCIKVGGLPFSDVKEISYTLPDKNMYQEHSKTLSSNAGVTNRLLYSDTQLSATEVIYSVEIDSFIATKVYPQYATWLSTIVNTFTKKYKFQFTFEGTNLTQNRKERLDNSMKLADKGMVNFQKISSAMGMNVFEFEEQLAYSGKSKIWESLRLLPNVNTANSGEGSSGRPKASADDMVADETDRNPNRIVE